MRPVLHGDVSALARALLAVPQAERRMLCRRIIAEAEAADRHVRRTGQLHPRWGNGSIMSASRKRQLADELAFDDVEYCQCFEMALRELRRSLMAPRTTPKRN